MCEKDLSINSLALLSSSSVQTDKQIIETLLQNIGEIPLLIDPQITPNALHYQLNKK